MKDDHASCSVAFLRRSISVLLFLSVFFLPLHVHVATAVTSQITKECSCLSGSRTQLNPAASPQICAPILSHWAIALFPRDFFDSRSIRTRSPRAPPFSISL